MYVCARSPIIAGLVKDSLAPGCAHGGSSASDICRHENKGIRLTILCICLYLFVCVFFMCIACIYANRLFGQNYDLEEMTQRLLQNEYAWGEGAPTSHDNNYNSNNNNNTYTSPTAQVYKQHSLTNSSTWDQPPLHSTAGKRMGHNYGPCVEDGNNDDDEESGSSSFDVPIFSGMLLSQATAGHGYGDDGEYEPDNVN